MCGINGIIFKNNKLEFEKISQMNSMLEHRGPDLSGTMSHKNLLIGHTRLSILDTSSKGAQPMSNDGRHWIIYNGEIYNYIELRDELIKKNHSPINTVDNKRLKILKKKNLLECIYCKTSKVEKSIMSPKVLNNKTMFENVCDI